MSHELRTPLNAIIGYSEILLEDATDRGNKASMGDLEKIQAAGKHLLGLIKLLDLSKSAQPISKLGFALAAIAGRNREMKSGAMMDEKVR